MNQLCHCELIAKKYAHASYIQRLGDTQLVDVVY